ncbi:class II fructose-bisphosphate aldolase [Pectinatus sottacetonis]|uniref:class II fructose-bisphosphate aldolase n=1 Tax=Pectinatus sottacetonis TaxID=1002795 RepID=UPI0018C7A256|nr:class II fructose-bisphosphate aldolase [Pectinatus sottacetonis]
MSLVNLTEMLNNARKDKYAVGAFDVSNLEMALAVVEVAQEKNSPVILMGLCLDLQGDKFDYLLYSLKGIAEKSSIPVCIHLDHATDIEFIKKCIDAGFSSVMFDGSMLSLEENIMKTKYIVDYAHKFNVSVEAELGHVGDGIVGNSEIGAPQKDTFDNPEDTLTRPDELKYFIDSTQVDCIAVAVGTAHGIYVSKPKIHFDRLKELNEISTVPMVMHGGSGTPDELIKKSVQNGICKLNIFSEMLTAFYGTMKDELNTAEHLAIWPYNANEKPLAALKDIVRAKIDLVGSSQKA